MIAVIFEAFPAEGKRGEYFDIAAELFPELHNIPGFISIERFQSLKDKGKLLSLSFWKDEQSIAQWRNVDLHRTAQATGRRSTFKDYRLRVANVLRDYGMLDRNQVPADSKTFHD